MFNYEELKQLLLPIINRFYIVLICFVFAVYFAYKSVQYSTPMYESTLKLKLDDQRFGSSNNKLYKDFDVFVSPQQIEAEVQVLKSAVLLDKAIDKLNLTVSYFRVGSIVTTEMYDKSPFKVNYSFTDPKFKSIEANIKVTSNNEFQIAIPYKGTTLIQNHTFNTPFDIGPANFTVVKDTTIINSVDYKLIDNYTFKIKSREELLGEITDKYLEIAAVDKDIPVIRITYKSGVPNRAADFVNALAKAYIDDYVEMKTVAAAKTVEFIDGQLLTIGNDLKNSENNLEQFKLDNKVVNTYQETETGLRKLTQQKGDLLHLEMENKALDDLNQKIISNQDFSGSVPNFGFGDLLFTELVKKLKAVQDERGLTLLRYTVQHPKVKMLDEQIADLKKYLVDGIATSKKQNDIKKAELAIDVEKTSHQFDALPTREKKQVIKERNFRLNELMYNFLEQKRTEAAIQTAANISFHRIIQPAIAAKKPVSPNKTLIMFVSGLFGAILGIIICFFIEQTKGTAHNRGAVEKTSSLPILGIIGSKADNTNSNHFSTLVKRIQLTGQTKKGMIVSVTSTVDMEGKTYVSKELANTFSTFGFSTLYISVEDKIVEMWRDGNGNQKQNNTDTEITNDIYNVVNGNTPKPKIPLASQNPLNKLNQLDENSFAPLQLNADGSETDSKNASKKDSMATKALSSLRKLITHTDDGAHVLSISKKSLPMYNRLSVDDVAASLNNLKSMYDVIVVDAPAAALSIDAITFMKVSDINLYLFRMNKTNKKYILHADTLQQEYDIHNLFWILNDVKGSYSYHGHYSGGEFTKKNWVSRFLSRSLPFNKNVFNSWL